MATAAAQQLGAAAGEAAFADSLRAFVEGALAEFGLEKGPDAWGTTGLFATRPLEDGVKLSVPRRFVLDAPTAARTVLGQKLAGAGLSPGEILLLVLAAARREGSRSPFAAYAETLPATAPDPLSWPEQARALLDGTDLGSSLPAAEQELAALERKVASSASLLSSCQEELGGIGLQQIRWAHGMVLSRRFPVSPPPDAESPEQQQQEEAISGLNSPGSLVPIADLLNHSPSRKADISWTAAAGVAEGGAFVVSCPAVPLGSGDEALIDYGSGAKSNEELLAMYGFAQESNPMDAVALCITRPGCEEDRSRICYIGRRGLTAELWEALLDTGDQDQAMGDVEDEDDEEDDDAAEAAALEALREALTGKLKALEERSTAVASASAAEAVPEAVLASVRHYRNGLREVLVGALAELDMLEQELG